MLFMIIEKSFYERPGLIQKNDPESFHIVFNFRESFSIVKRSKEKEFAFYH